MSAARLPGTGATKSWSQPTVQLFKIPASGGVPERLPVPEGRYPVAPQFLPDDRHLIYTDSSRGVGPVVVMSLDGQEHRELVVTDAPALFVPPHHLLFVRGTALMSQVFESQRLALEGTPVLVTPNVLLGLQHRAPGADLRVGR